MSSHVAVVTGASKGIGAAVARVLASRGHTVVLVARGAELLAAVADDIRDRGGRAVDVPVDVGDGHAVRALRDRLERDVGPIGILVNNAAVVQPLGRLWDIDAEDFERSLRINVTGAWNCLAAFVPAMLGHGWGRVVGVSSEASLMALPTFGPYSAGKAAFERLHAVAAAETEDTPVRVNWVWPGAVDTPLQGELREDAFALAEVARGVHAAGLLHDPAEVANRVADLCGEHVEHGRRVILDAAMAATVGVSPQ